MLDKNITVGIIGAMDREVDTLKAAVENPTKISKAGMDFVLGTLSGRKVVIVKSGIGKVNAAICTQILVDDFGVKFVINTGAAGSLDSNVRIGDIVIGTEVGWHDVDAVDFGWKLGVVPFMPEYFEADADMCEWVASNCRRLLPEVSVHLGRIVSGDVFVGRKDKKEWISEHFNALCTEMEGAAVAQAAYINKIPFLILRAMSDEADDEAGVSFEEFSVSASERNIRLLKEIL